MVLVNGTKIIWGTVNGYVESEIITSDEPPTLIGADGSSFIFGDDLVLKNSSRHEFGVLVLVTLKDIILY